jgi:hypothetical protein
MNQMKGLSRLTCFFMGVNGHDRVDNLQTGVPRVRRFFTCAVLATHFCNKNI